MKRKLANKPSELILQALEDAELIENDPNYKFDMSMWHRVVLINNKCEVCIAGCLIAKSLDSPFLSTTPINFRYSTTKKLEAIDHFRVGNLRLGLSLLGYDNNTYELPEKISEHYIPDMQIKIVRRTLESLVGIFQAVGL